MIFYAVMGITGLIYGINFLLYYHLKKAKKSRDTFEKATLFFCANMSLLFVAGLIIFFVKLIEDGILYF